MDQEEVVVIQVLVLQIQVHFQQQKVVQLQDKVIQEVQAFMV